jgi:hypothetical protein
MDKSLIILGAPAGLVKRKASSELSEIDLITGSHKQIIGWAEGKRRDVGIERFDGFNSPLINHAHAVVIHDPFGCV